MKFLKKVQKTYDNKHFFFNLLTKKYNKITIFKGTTKRGILKKPWILDFRLKKPRETWNIRSFENKKLGFWTKIYKNLYKHRNKFYILSCKLLFYTKDLSYYKKLL